MLFLLSRNQGRQNQKFHQSKWLGDGGSLIAFKNIWGTSRAF
jgi:hypothetical protein